MANTTSRAIRAPSGISDRSAGCVSVHFARGMACCSTPITRNTIQNTATIANAFCISTMNVWAGAASAIQRSRIRDATTDQSRITGPRDACTSASSNSLSVLETIRRNSARVGPPSVAPMNSASGTRISSAIHCQ